MKRKWLLSLKKTLAPVPGTNQYLIHNIVGLIIAVIGLIAYFSGLGEWALVIGASYLGAVTVCFILHFQARKRESNEVHSQATDSVHCRHADADTGLRAG
ncbi:MAG: hypothetical protein IKP40_14295 [Clostridia bacterium]|nr:hypothetical protein [Clostridia bacterium]